jgi:DNA-directed RNA polymerase specialized sigma24 family protein
LTKVTNKKELTQEKFADFLTWLNPDFNLAGEEYERLRFRLITFFSQRNCRFPDELADETINRIALKLSEITIENKMAYAFGIAKNVLLESYRKEKEFVNVEEVQLVAKEEEIKFEDKCLDKCLSELSGENRTLIINYFSENKSAKITLREKLSENLGITQANLRMRILRIKQTLKNCLVKCSA